MIDSLLSYYNLGQFLRHNIKKEKPRPLAMKSETTAEVPQDNPFLNLIVNILLPVMVLNKGSHYLGPRLALGIALCFPLGYGLQDYIRRKHKNYVSLIGMVNICLTGSLALMNLHGNWFAMKEATLPMLLGLLVLGSAWTNSPAAQLMFCNPQVLDMSLIERKLTELSRAADFQALLKRTTVWLSFSFFISSVCNGTLALRIFKDIDPNLTEGAQSQVLNEQIARMTWMGFAIIALPLMIFSGTLVYFFLKRVSQMTETPMNSLLKG
jgi:hypothetical protein